MLSKNAQESRTAEICKLFDVEEAKEKEMKMQQQVIDPRYCKKK